MNIIMIKINKKKFFGLIIIFCLIVVFYNFFYKSPKPISKDIQMDIAQYYAGTVSCIEYCEKANILIDPEFKYEIKKSIIKLLDNINTDKLEITTVSDMILLNNYFNLGHEEYLNKILDSFYSKDQKLFALNSYDTYNGKVNDMMYKIFVSLSLSEFPILKSNCSSIEKYNVDEGLAIWYNNNIDTLNNLNKDSEDYSAKKRNLVGIFWYLNENNLLDLIKVDDNIVNLLSSYIEYDQTIFDNSYEINIKNAVLARELSDYRIRFYNDYTLDNLSGEIFNKINTDKVFVYTIQNKYYFLTLATNLKVINKIGDNNYFKENINRWLKENYEYNMRKIVLENLENR